MTTKVEDGKTPRFEGQISLPDNSTGTTVTSSTANTYGAWIVFSADIGDIDNYLNELFGLRLAVDTLTEFEVGIGAGGSEVVIAQGHTQQIAGVQESGRISFNNVRVPANSRLAVRVRDNVAPTHAYIVFLSLNH